MPETDKAAQEIANCLVSEKVDKKIAFDPMVIMTIISIIVSIVRAYQECKKTPTQAHSEFKSLGIIERWRLRRFIKQKIDDPEVYEHLGSQLFNSISLYGTKVTQEQVAKIFAEA